MKIGALTGLRFLAAFYVLLFHVIPTKGHFPEWLRSFASYGDASVGFFFVLSGFVLTYSYVRDDGSIKTTTPKFLWARFTRIYPVYFLAFLLYAPAMYLLHQENPVVTGLLTLLLVQSWFRMENWNLPGWSLCNEAFFYLCWPIAVKILRFPFVTLCVAWLLAIAPPLLGIGSLEHLPLARLPEFLMGMCFALIFRKPHTVGLLLILGSCSVALAAFASPSHLLINVGLFDPLYLALIYIATTKPNRLLSSSWMQLLGDSSYSLYIIQSPIFILFKGSVMFALRSSKEAVDASNWFICGYIVIVVVASIFVHKLIEIPARTWLMNRFAHEREISLAATASS